MHVTDGSLPELELMLHVPKSSTSDDLLRCSTVARSSSGHSQIPGSHRHEIRKAKRKNNCWLGLEVLFLFSVLWFFLFVCLFVCFLWWGCGGGYCFYFNCHKLEDSPS